MRRAQAALEFITTYGWAILVIMVMAGSFAYFGVLNPAKLTPERCSVSPEFSCNDFKITTSATSTSAGNVSMIFTQTLGQTIYPTNFSCSYQGLVGAATSSIPFASSWSPKSSLIAMCNNTIPPSLKGEKIKISYTISYKTSSTGLTHTADGELVAEAQ